MASSCLNLLSNFTEYQGKESPKNISSSYYNNFVEGKKGINGVAHPIALLLLLFNGSLVILIFLALVSPKSKRNFLYSLYSNVLLFFFPNKSFIRNSCIVYGFPNIEKKKISYDSLKYMKGIKQHHQ